MVRSTKARLALGGVVVLVLIAVAWVAWQVWRVEKDLSASVRDANAVTAAVSSGDRAKLTSTLAELERDSRSAERRTTGFTWSALAHVPFFGDDARGVRTMSQVLSDLARDGVSPLAKVSGEADTLLPRHGAIDVAALTSLRPTVDQARAAFATADSRLSAIDPSGFIGPLRSKYDEFLAKVSHGASAMSATDTAVRMLPTVLGAHGPKKYLLVFQNNAEIRATGGLPGALAEVSATDGKLKIVRQLSGAALEHSAKRPLPISSAERALYGGVFGQYFVDANFTPDVPRASGMMRAWWNEAYPTDRVDGVVLVDAVSMSSLLQATGPIDVDGVHLTADNLVDELLSRTYARLNGQQQDKFFADVAKAAFEHFVGGASNATGVASAMARSVAEGRISVHSFDPGLQRQIAGTQLAGDVLSNPAKDRPQASITINDTTSSKMSYYLRSQVDGDATYCTNGVQGMMVKMHLHSTAPADAAKTLTQYVTGPGDVKRGDELVTLRIFGPVGGSIGQLTWNDEPMRLIRTTQDGRPVAMTYVELSPGQTVDLTWTMTSGKGQTGDPELTVTPTIERADTMSALPSAC